MNPFSAPQRRYANNDLLKFAERSWISPVRCFRTWICTWLLIVDDEFLILDFLSSEFAEAGHAVICASNAEEALSKLEGQSDVDAMITDINMPGKMDGLGLAAAVCRRWPEIRIIVVSGRREPDKRELPPGAIFVGKPYSPSQVVALLESSQTRH